MPCSERLFVTSRDGVINTVAKGHRHHFVIHHPGQSHRQDRQESKSFRFIINNECRETSSCSRNNW